MRDYLNIFLALVFLILGSVLLYDGVSSSDANQSARILAGAASLSLGLVILRAALKNWWKWKKLSKDYRKI
jgi:membrane protease YdiL (CAAX protease family)